MKLANALGPELPAATRNWTAATKSAWQSLDHQSKFLPGPIIIIISGRTVYRAHTFRIFMAVGPVQNRVAYKRANARLLKGKPCLKNLSCFLALDWHLARCESETLS